MNSNGEIARRFAEGRTCGASGHMFIDGDGVYSYGRHFCIARRYNGKILMTTRTYSNTTAKHIHEVYSAVVSECLEIIRVYDPDGTIEQNIKWYDDEIARLEAKIRRARTCGAYWRSYLEKTMESKEKYIALYDSEDKYKQPFDN